MLKIKDKHGKTVYKLDDDDEEPVKVDTAKPSIEDDKKDDEDEKENE